LKTGNICNSLFPLRMKRGIEISPKNLDKIILIKAETQRTNLLPTRM